MMGLKNNMFLCMLVQAHKVCAVAEAHAAEAAKADCDGFR